MHVMECGDVVVVVLVVVLAYAARSILHLLVAPPCLQRHTSLIIGMKSAR